MTNELRTNESPAALLPEGRRIAIARDEFFASLSGATLSGAPTGVYLRNRLELAFIEGWKAAKLDASTAPVASESRGSVPEHLTVSMCRSYDYAAGWNACRDAMLAAAPTPPAVSNEEGAFTARVVEWKGIRFGVPAQIAKSFMEVLEGTNGEPTAEQWKRAWELEQGDSVFSAMTFERIERRARELARSAAARGSDQQNAT